MQKKVVRKPMKKVIKKTIRRSKRLGVDQFIPTVQTTDPKVRVLEKSSVTKEGDHYTYVRGSRKEIEQDHMYEGERKLMLMNNPGSNERAIVHDKNGNINSLIEEGDVRSVRMPEPFTKIDWDTQREIPKNKETHTHHPVHNIEKKKTTFFANTFSTQDCSNPIRCDDRIEDRVIMGQQGVASLSRTKVGQGDHFADVYNAVYPKFFKEKQEEKGIDNKIKGGIFNITDKYRQKKLTHDHIYAANETSHEAVKHAAKKAGMHYKVAEIVREDPDESGYFGNTTSVWNPDTEQWDVGNLNADGNLNIDHHVTESVAIRRKSPNKVVKKKPVTRKKPVTKKKK